VTLKLDQTTSPPDSLLPGTDLTPSRRAFLQWSGFGVASAALTGCSRGPTKSVIPYLEAPEGIVSGRAYWIATTCHGCSAACGVLARCLDGRPVKVEGNPQHGLSQGGLCAVGQAEVLSLYDSRRLETPQMDGSPATWEAADAELTALLRASGKVRLLTGTLHGPSTRAAIASFVDRHADARHVSYDALSVSAILDAHERTHGRRSLPSYRFERAEVIVSFDADFLGTWISPVSFAKGYAAGRRPDAPDARMSRHIQLESRMSLTGSAADRRLRLAPWEVAQTLTSLCSELERLASATERLSGAPGEARLDGIAAGLAAELWEARGKSLVVCGENDVEAQVLTAYANELLGNYGQTLSLARPSLQRQGDDRELVRLADELDAGEVDLLVVSGVNPAYDLPPELAASIARAGTLVVHSAGQDETAAAARIVLPAPHSLEAWDDGEPEAGRYSLTQPTVPPLRSGRTLRHVLAAWGGDSRGDDELLRETWSSELHGRLGSGQGFDAFFAKALHDGFIQSADADAGEPSFQADAVVAPTAGTAPEGLALVLYPKVGLLDGRHAHNPWLQELPDPQSKITWDNYACFSETRAEELGVELGDVVRITTGDGGVSLELPVVVQRGQHDGVVAIALGYGRLGTDRFSDVGPNWLEGKVTVEPGQTIGVNAAPLLEERGGNLAYSGRGVQVERTGRRMDLAATQDHHSLEIPAHIAPKGGEVRHAVRYANFEEYQHDPAHAIHHPHVPDADLWPDDHAPPGHHWAMAVDISACIGCSACAVSCQAENNVPVVGKDEVLRHREMAWMRVDRYLAGQDDEVTASYQPMFCQQCDNAPCEAVCPVLATVHSSEGLNQQVYNRCVGTRYCANTCPYKVRRFNWFNYSREDELQNHSLNPDVTVRTRGVMEKCTFCAQRIQEAKSVAKAKGVELADGDIQVACQQSCPTNAIVFGDLADPESRVAQVASGPRAYGVLAELNVKPSVSYLARIRNVPAAEQEEEEQHAR